jgi:hypothetical protein
MIASRIPGFTAAASLASHTTAQRLRNRLQRSGPTAVIPQMSCWRLCYDGASTNHELADCFRACTAIKNIFNL